MINDNWFKFIVLALLIFLVARSIHAEEIYTWTDVWGTTHFVDNKDKVPAKYPLTKFTFHGENRWSVDKSKTKASNQTRLEALRKFNHKEIVISAPPQVKVEIIERRRSHRKHVRY